MDMGHPFIFVYRLKTDLKQSPEGTNSPHWFDARTLPHSYSPARTNQSFPFLQALPNKSGREA